MYNNLLDEDDGEEDDQWMGLAEFRIKFNFMTNFNIIWE